MLTPTALLLTALAGQTWIVDALGNGDFLDLPQAVAAVAPGDTLFVNPGNYSAFVLDKQLEILGRAGGWRPAVAGESRVEGAASFALVGLDFEDLIVRNVPGEGVIDDCDIGTGLIAPVGIEPQSFLIENCAQVLVSATTAWGKGGDDTEFEEPALVMRNSGVVVSSSMLWGATGSWFTTGGQPDAGTGGTGISVGLSSNLLLVDSSVYGGNAGPCIAMQGGFASGGNAVQIDFTSSVTVRGWIGNYIAGGGACGFGNPGFSLIGSGVAVYSGASMAGVVWPGLNATELSQPEPVLSTSGPAVTGGLKWLTLRGPDGETGFIVLSTRWDLLSLPGVAGSLWIDPTAPMIITPVATKGQMTPKSMVVSIPGQPALEGIVWPAQAVFVQPDLSLFVTNPVPFVVRY